MANNYDIIDIIIKKFRQDRKNNNYFELLNDGLAILEEIPKLIDISVREEGLYRKFEASLLDERNEDGKRNTSAFCETKAKATEHYEAWQRAKQYTELAYELAIMSKRLAGSVDKELKAQ